jgi:hypothetical protein
MVEKTAGLWEQQKACMMAALTVVRKELPMVPQKGDESVDYLAALMGKHWAAEMAYL